MEISILLIVTYIMHTCVKILELIGKEDIVHTCVSILIFSKIELEINDHLLMLINDHLFSLLEEIDSVSLCQF